MRNLKINSKNSTEHYDTSAHKSEHSPPLSDKYVFMLFIFFPLMVYCFFTVYWLLKCYPLAFDPSNFNFIHLF